MIKLNLKLINYYVIQETISFAYENVYIYDVVYSSSLFRTFVKF